MSVYCKDCVHAHARPVTFQGLPRVRWCIVFHQTRAISVPRECESFEHPLAAEAVGQVAAALNAASLTPAPLPGGEGSLSGGDHV